MIHDMSLPSALAIKRYTYPYNYYPKLYNSSGGRIDSSSVSHLPASKRGSSSSCSNISNKFRLAAYQGQRKRTRKFNLNNFWYASLYRRLNRWEKSWSIYHNPLEEGNQFSPFSHQKTKLCTPAHTLKRCSFPWWLVLWCTVIILIDDQAGINCPLSIRKLRGSSVPQSVLKYSDMSWVLLLCLILLVQDIVINTITHECILWSCLNSWLMCTYPTEHVWNCQKSLGIRFLGSSGVHWRKLLMWNCRSCDFLSEVLDSVLERVCPIHSHVDELNMNAESGKFWMCLQRGAREMI